MFRRTLLLFAGFVALVLAITTGYALLGLSGPRTAIADADAAIAGRRIAEGIRFLDAAERTLTPAERAELLPVILERRFAAHRDLDNTTMARRDLEALLELDPDGRPELRIDQAALLLAGGEADAALDTLATLRAAHPDVRPGKVLEIAGQATQALYQRAIVELVASVGDSLAGDAKQAALDELRRTLYRRRDDPQGVAARDRFEDLARRYAPSQPNLDRWRRQIDDIRAGIQRANEFYAKSLEASDAEPVAAFRGLAYALQQAGRHDELVALGEIYLRRFEHAFSADAALIIAETHMAAGRWALAADIAARALPRGTAVTRAVAGTLTPVHKQLMLIEARALDRLGDRVRLQVLSNDVIAVHEAKESTVSMLPEYFMVRAYFLVAVKQTEHALRALADYRKHREVRAWQPRAGSTDNYALAAELELKILDSLGGKVPESDAVLADWLELRPESVPALQRRCRHYLATGRPDFATADAERLLALAPHDEDALALLVEGTVASAERAGTGPAYHLARCLARGSNDPREVRHPALHLALGQLAIEKGHAQLALRCAELAGRSYSWARWPRRLLVDAALAAKDFDRALRAAQTFRELHPRDGEALASYRKAAAAAGQIDLDLLFETALHGEPDADLALALLDTAVRHPASGYLPALAQRIAQRFDTTPRVMVSAGAALLAHGAGQEGRALLKRVIDEFPADHQSARTAATQLLLADAAQGAAAPELEASVQRFATRFTGDVATSLDIAERLETIGRPALALRLLEPLLAAPDSDERGGRLYHLAGRVALETGDETRAETLLTAALGFGDAPGANLALALLWLRHERAEDAKSAVWLNEASDEATACLMLALGRHAPAQRWAMQRLRQVPLDVIATLILVLAPTGAPVPGTGATAGLLPTHREALLELLPIVTMPGFQVLAENAARRLREIEPKSGIVGFLHARALALTGRRDDAILALVQVIQRDAGFLPAYDEVLRLSEGGLHGDISAVGLPMTKIVQAAPGFASPRVMTAVGHSLASIVGAVNRDLDRTYEMLAKLWILYPEESRCDLTHVIALNARGKSQDATLLLEAIENRLPPADRSHFLDLYFSLGQGLAAAGDATQSARLDAYATRVIEKEGAYGAAVHYRLDRLEAANGAPAKDPRGKAANEARALLLRHLEFVEGGHDRTIPMILRSLARLEELDGTRVALQHTDELLRADPTLLPVWRHRARLLSARGEPVAAAASLRWIDDYLPDQDALLELARIAGTAGEVRDEDAATLRRELDARSRAAPHARFPLALLSLRAGDLAEADAGLRQSLPQPDGAHLFFLAITNVQRQGGLAAATEAFQALARDYPASSYAVYAQHFVSQLTLLQEKEARVGSARDTEDRPGKPK